MTTRQTQCPSCQHLFDITDEQLKLKQGYARCGNCKSIFSAIDHLVSTINRTPIQPTPATAKPTKRVKQVADGDFTFDDNAGLGLDNDTPNNKADDGFDIIENFDTLVANKVGQPANKTQDESWLADLLEEENRKEEQERYTPDVDKFGKIGRENDVSSMLDNLGVDVAYEAPIEQEDYQQKVEERFSQQIASQKNIKAPVGMALVWLVGSLLLIGTLVAQYTVFNLDELLKKPESASHIQTVCGILKCELPVANASVVQTETLSLKAKDSKQSDMTFTLTNSTTQKVIYPNLKISLRDSNDIKAQLVLTPNQYLDDTSSYLMPNQIKAFKLRIDYPKANYTQANIETFY